MRVLFASLIADNRWTGMGKWSHRVAEEMAALGHEPTLWFIDDFPAVARAGRFGVLLGAALVARRIVQERGRYDVAVVHEPSAWASALLRRAGARLPPIVSMSHGVERHIFEDMAEAKRRGYAVPPRLTRFKTPVSRLWQGDLAIRHADHVVCLSTTDREFILRRHGRDPADVTLMINGIDADDLQERTSAPPGARVLFLGGWLDTKGRRLLPELWARGRAARPDARRTRVGTGTTDDQVLGDFPAALRPSLRVVQRVEQREDMRAIVAAHDVFLMPSLAEGSPLALLEAMAAGLPPVAAAAGGIPDIVRDGDSGLLFPWCDAAAGADALLRVLGDPALAARLGAGARARAAQLTWRDTALTLDAVVRRLRGEPASAATRAPEPAGRRV